MKLHKLSNGNWIDMAKVTAIKCAPRVECWPGGPVHPARVIVCMGDTLIEVIPCDDMAQAAQMADELAALVNQP